MQEVCFTVILYWLKVKFRFVLQTVISYDFPVEPGAVFQGSPLGGVIHVDQPEPFGETVRPFKVIHQRPGEVSLERHPVPDGF